METLDQEVFIFRVHSLLFLIIKISPQQNLNYSIKLLTAVIERVAVTFCS